MLIMHSLPGRPTPSPLYSSSFGPSMCTWGGSKPGRKLRPKEDGASQLERAEPHSSSLGLQLYLTSSISLHTGPIAGGLRGTGRVHVRGGLTPGSQWAAESERGPRDRRALSPTGSSLGQTTSLHVATSTGTHMDAIEAASMPGLYWLLRGGIELYVGAEE